MFEYLSAMPGPLRVADFADEMRVMTFSRRSMY